MPFEVSERSEKEDHITIYTAMDQRHVVYNR